MAVIMGRSGAAERLLRILFQGGTLGGLTDAELLERFVARDDTTAEPAFAVLVERHGPLVQRSAEASLAMSPRGRRCFSVDLPGSGQKSRVVASSNLARSLAACGGVPGRAREARSITAQRLKHERRAAEMASETENITSGTRRTWNVNSMRRSRSWGERHRRPIVLCDLEGLTHEQAARLLTTPVGTIKSRLARGRDLLRHRLSRRGLTLSGGMLTVVLAPDASQAEVIGPVVDQTARTAMLVANRGPLVAGTVPASVNILVQGVLRSMFRSRLKMAGGAVFLTVSIAIGAAFAALGVPPRGKPSLQAAPFTQGLIRPASVNLVGHGDLVRSVAFLPGGRDLISAASPSDERKQPGEIRIWDVTAGETLRTLKLDGDPFAMAVAADGHTLAVAIARGDLADRSLIVRVVALPSAETTRE